jgi:hypothetical protein
VSTPYTLLGIPVQIDLGNVLVATVTVIVLFWTMYDRNKTLSAEKKLFEDAQKNAEKARISALKDARADHIIKEIAQYLSDLRYITQLNVKISVLKDKLGKKINSNEIKLILHERADVRSNANHKQEYINLLLYNNEDKLESNIHRCMNLFTFASSEADEKKLHESALELECATKEYVRSLSHLTNQN